MTLHFNIILTVTQFDTILSVVKSETPKRKSLILRPQCKELGNNRVK